MEDYIISVRNGNPQIQKRNSNGHYEVIAFGAGDDSLENITELVKLANSAEV